MLILMPMQIEMLILIIIKIRIIKMLTVTVILTTNQVQVVLQVVFQILLVEKLEKLRVTGIAVLLPVHGMLMFLELSQLELAERMVSA